MQVTKWTKWKLWNVIEYFIDDNISVHSLNPFLIELKNQPLFLGVFVSPHKSWSRKKIKLQIDGQPPGDHHSVVISNSRKIGKYRDFVFVRKSQKSNGRMAREPKYTIQLFLLIKKEKRFYSWKLNTLFW